MSSNDDDRDGAPSGDEPIVPDRQWVLRPNRVPGQTTPTPPVPPPGAPGAGATPPRPQPTVAPRDEAPRPAPMSTPREAPAAPPVVRATPATPSPVAPSPTSSPAAASPAHGAPAPGGVRSWGAPSPAPAPTPAPAPAAAPSAPAPAPAPAPKPVAPVVAGQAAAADPPTLTPADSPAAQTPLSRSGSPTNVTLGPAQRNAPAGTAAPAPAAPAAATAAPAPATARPGVAGRTGRPLPKGGPTVADLAQQLAATQAQVAALSAQLTTLAHRLTYDVERGAQTTSEKVVRDLERTLADAVALRVGAHLGPAVDDLTDQLAEDLAPKVEDLAAKVQDVTELDLGTRLGTITDAIDSLPIGNVEVLAQLRALGTDLQDRFERFSTRIYDQFSQLERQNLAELLRLRDQLEELRSTAAAPSADMEVLRRISGHVERLAQRTPGTAGIVAAVETLITEHLESVRLQLDEQVGALAPTLQAELEAVREENLTAIGAVEHDLLEQVATLEAGLTERLDGALADHLDGIDALLAERQGELVTAVASTGKEQVEEAVEQLHEVGTARLEEVAAVANLGADRIDELVAAVQDLQELVAETAAAGDDDDGDDGAEVLEAVEALTSTVVEELQALRRRITLRMEADEEAPAPELSAAQIEAIADAVVRRLAGGRSGRPAADDEGDAGATPTIRAPRATKATKATKAPTRRRA